MQADDSPCGLDGVGGPGARSEALPDGQPCASFGRVDPMHRRSMRFCKGLAIRAGHPLGGCKRRERTLHVSAPPQGRDLEVLAMAIEMQPRLTTQDDGAHVLAAENVRGYDVRSADNDHLGRVDDLIIEESSGRVRLLKVGDGGILGIGRTHRMVPVDVVKGVSGDYVFLDVSDMQFDNAPRWRPLADPTYLTEVLQYFGTEPFWRQGYQPVDWTNPD